MPDSRKTPGVRCNHHPKAEIASGHGARLGRNGESPRARGEVVYLAGRVCNACAD